MMHQISETTQNLFDQYLELVLEANKKINLTRIDSLEQARVLHLEDSLSALKEVMEAPQGLYGDLGTGGGFPGIPLAIVTGRDTVLVDSVQKKIKVLDDIVAQLGLSAQITSFAGRIEDLALVQKSSFSLLTARALSQLNSLLELASPLLKKHGHLVCYKAHVTDEELALAADLESMLGMRLISRRSFTLSDDLTYREILVYEKVSHPRIKLPRRVGLAQKKPLTAR